MKSHLLLIIAIRGLCGDAHAKAPVDIGISGGRLRLTLAPGESKLLKLNVKSGQIR